MSKATQDPTKYWRTGVAITLARKESFDERIAKLGFKTLGDLAVFFCDAEGVVEALAPLAKKHKALVESSKSERSTKLDIMSEVRKMSVDDLRKFQAMLFQQQKDEESKAGAA
jgi:hypothetical protein